MGNIAEVHTVTTLEEERHTSNEAKHGVFVVRIHLPDNDEKDASDDAVGV